MNRKSARPLVLFLGIAVLFSISAGAAFAQSASPAMTRAEFAAKIADYFAWPHPTDYNDIWKVPLKRINDVKTEDRFGKQIEVAVERGVMGTDVEGFFYPDKPITRQDAALVLFKTFGLPTAEIDRVSLYGDGRDVKPIARESLNAILDLLPPGFMGVELKPNGPMSPSEVNAIFDLITSTFVAPVQAVPVQNAIAPRRYVKLWCPTPGATIYYTDDGTTPSAKSAVYSVAAKGHVNEMLSNAQLPERDVVYKAFAVKEGLVQSAAQTFVWRLYRPAVADFQHLLIQEKTATSPAIYRIYNDSESVRAMAWYIEGQTRGLVFDALQTAPEVKNLKEYVDRNLAKLPYSLVIGHEHGDHDAQGPAFLKAGVDVYSNKRGWNSLGSASGPFPAVFPSAADQARIKDVDEGDSFHLGGCDLDVYAMPGHANGNIILHDKANGLIFASDIYGCTRAGSADNVNVSGVRVDLLLSLAQQTYSNYMKGGGKTTRLFTGHDETPLADINMRLFEQALQQVVDKGEAGCSPTLRGKNDAPNSRTTIIGDMWKDGTNWISLKLAGTMGDKTPYLTSTPTDYNGSDGYLKYSVLSNIEIEGGDLVGTTVSWAPPTASFSWGGTAMSVPNSLPDKFDPWTYAYTIKVPASAKSITIVPTTMSTKVKSIKLNGKAIEYRSSNTVAVADGTVVTIDIVAPDGVTTSTYKFTVKK